MRRAMDVRERLTELVRITSAASPVVSVYLNTRWRDEHQRERVRVFLKNELRRARLGAEPALGEDLDWIGTEGESLIGQARFPEAHGVALFACRALGLREVLPVRVPFEDAFVVAERPFLRPLAALAERVPVALVVFVDGESARLIPVEARGPGEEVALESEVPGHHRRGGWALLAQSRYQRHVQDHRGRHFEAVATALADLAEANGLDRIVLAGESRTVGAFRRHLPARLGERVVGSVPAARHEPGATIVARATAVLDRWRHERQHAAVDAVLTEAAKGGQAVAGLEETLEAVARGAVQRLYLSAGFGERGRVCGECGALQPGPTGPCRRCGEATAAVELGEAMVDRVLATGGAVETIEAHAGLPRVGGVAARLRYPL
ncbi:MAG: host attachment protein [Candidatus Rokubacteria bacterium]|nr:host attachment protein [Candidatus Rokubacteria bacterium]